MLRKNVREIVEHWGVGSNPRATTRHWSFSLAIAQLINDETYRIKRCAACGKEPFGGRFQAHPRGARRLCRWNQKS